jgi:hypothetical protein
MYVVCMYVCIHKDIICIHTHTHTHTHLGVPSEAPAGKLPVYEALSVWGLKLRPSADSVWGLKLPVYEALSWGLKLLVYEALSY